MVVLTTPDNISDLFRSGRTRPHSPAVERSLELLVNTIAELYESDGGVSIKAGCLHCVDNFEGHEITWVLNVKQSINHALRGNLHMGLDVMHKPKDGSVKSRSVCVLMSKELPVGDSLVSWLLLYRAGELTNSIRTMDTAARKVCGMMGEKFSSSQVALMATWSNFSENLIEQAESNFNRFNGVMNHELDDRIFIARQLMGMEIDGLDYFNSDDRHELVSIVFKHCQCIDTLRVVIASAGATGEEEYISPLQSLVRSKPEDPRVSRAAIYAICRLQESSLSSN